MSVHDWRVGYARCVNSHSVFRSIQVVFFLGLFAVSIERVEAIHGWRKTLMILVLYQLRCRNGGRVFNDGIGWELRSMLDTG